MKLTAIQLRRIIKEEVQKVLRENLEGFNPLPPHTDDEDPDLLIVDNFVSKFLRKPVNSLKICTSEDEDGMYDEHAEMVTNIKPLTIPDFEGTAESGMLNGMPVVLVNDWGMGTIYM